MRSSNTSRDWWSETRPSFRCVLLGLVQDNSGSSTITSVLGLLPDKDGSLWVRLPGTTMLRYRDGIFENVRSAPGWPDTNIAAMCRPIRVRSSFPSWNTAPSHIGKAFELLAEGKALPRSPVISMAQTSDGDIWMGTRDAGLFRIGGGRATAVTKGLPDPKINCLLPDGKQGLWVGTDDGVVRWNGSELTDAGMGASLNRLQALAMVKDRDGSVWIGTDSRGLLRLNAKGVSSLEEHTEAVTAILEDHEGNLWTGSASGIERLRDSAFVTHSTSEGLPSERNGPVYDSDGRTWFAPVNGGLYWSVRGSDGV